MQKLRQCLKCELPFIPTAPNQTYCEHCKLEKIGNPQPKKMDYNNLKPRPCTSCGKIYTPNFVTQFKICNVSRCRECIAERNNRKCKFCGKPLNLVRHAHQGFCNGDCAMFFEIELYRQRGGNMVKEIKQKSEISRQYVEMKIPLKGEIAHDRDR